MSASIMGEGCMWVQKAILLKARPRGCHLVTDEVEQKLTELANCPVGVLHLMSKVQLIRSGTDGQLSLYFQYNTPLPAYA